MVELRPGELNLITDVAGILVGNAEDPDVRTGVTAVRAPEGSLAAVDTRGGAPGTRETDALDATCLVDRIDAVVLSGGSVFGLAAADGAVARLAAEGRGYRLGPAIAPIVPAAILFDLANGGDKDWGDTSPYRALGARATGDAAREFAEGNAGAGYGAKAQALKGGLGSASVVDPVSGCTVGAVFAVNPFGSTLLPGQGSFHAWYLERENELGGQPPPEPTDPNDLQIAGLPGDGSPGRNTTIGVIATDADLDKSECLRLAMMAQDGLARAIRPAHTPFDGDVVFAISTRNRPIPDPRPVAITRLGALAADVTARAIARGVYCADALGNLPAYRDIWGHRLSSGRQNG